MLIGLPAWVGKQTAESACRLSEVTALVQCLAPCLIRLEYLWWRNLRIPFKAGSSFSPVSMEVARDRGPILRRPRDYHVCQ